jgi:hypothetical protein
MGKKLNFFFDVFPVKRGAGHGTAGRQHTNFQFFGLAPGGTIVPFTPAHSFARTHARTAPQPKPKSISQLDTPPNLQSIVFFLRVVFHPTLLVDLFAMR